MRAGGPVLMVASAATWAAGLVLTKVALDVTGAAPGSVLVVQLIASVGALAAACAATGARLAGAWRHGWVGLLEPGIAYQFALAGLALTSAANASVLGSLEPVMVPLIAWVLLRERPRPRLLVVIAGATAGSVLVAFSADGGSGSWAGDGMIVASVAAAALYVVVASRQVAAVEPLPAALTQQVWALGFVLVCQLALGGPLPSATPGQLLLIAAAGILNYALPFWLYLTALTRMRVARAATYLTLIPVFGVLGAVLVLGERVTWLDLVGGVLVVGSLIADARNAPADDEMVEVHSR
ncbi:EamA domain-containing membrane protein RarD [Pseudonocardia hierapolitana]|uniref:EamA domain-containing membrane protein RarD n=1 Tax=Pseudonocardia hierapolitana TaxID=1128676 RepID=A0A561SKZ6_9PSEU|nr:DMT family transporter [Pseudonocardia hierapolitana]TWF75533.1 EamA domain-containing membrane protein RarD [Pseudonocardia hierapolitana]